MATATADVPTTAGWRAPAGVMAVAAAVVGAILAITPAASSSTTQRDPACSDRFTTTGPLVPTCVERDR